MMKSSKIFILLLLAGTGLPLFAMEEARRTKLSSLKRKKPKPLRRVVLKREAVKAERSRVELEAERTKQNYINILYTKFETTKEQGHPQRRIDRLSEVEKSKLIETLQKRNKQMNAKLSGQFSQITQLIDITDYSGILNDFNQKSALSLLAAASSIDQNSHDFKIFLLQQYRRALGAIIWANQEFIKKYEEEGIL